MSLPKPYRIVPITFVSSLLTLASLVAFPFVTAAAPLVSETIFRASPTHESITRVSTPPAETARQSAAQPDSVTALYDRQGTDASSGSPESQTIQMVHRARLNLANQLGVPIGQIQVTSVTAVQWPNSSLGSPEPGRLYSSVVTPGYLIVLQANGQNYIYHTDTDNQVVYCPTS